MNLKLLSIFVGFIVINGITASPLIRNVRRRHLNLRSTGSTASIQVSPERREEASKVRAIYINLDHRTDRQNHMEQLLNAYQIPHSRLSAIYGMEIKDYLIDNKPLTMELLHGTAFHPDVLKPYIWEGNGHYGRIGCWQSHVQILLRMIQEVEGKGFPDVPVLILEDDITWPSSFGRHGLIKHMEELPNDWEMIVYGLDGRVCHPNLPKPNFEFCRIMVGYRAHAYVVRDIRVAKKLLSVLNTTMPQCLDYGWHKAFKHLLVAYGTTGSIVQRDNWNSNIPESGSHWEAKEPFWHKD